MEQQNLATALNATLDRQPGRKPGYQNGVAFLLAALERSTTRRELIVQRRIGQYHSQMTILK